MSKQTKQSEDTLPELNGNKVARLKGQLKDYFAADEALTEAKIEVERRLQARSRIVQEIRKEHGSHLRVNGKELTIVGRGETVFFRERKQKDSAVEVEI